MALAAFAPASKETAICYIAAVVCFALAFLPRAARVVIGSTSLMALGLGLWLWPTMWNAVDAAF